MLSAQYHRPPPGAQAGQAQHPSHSDNSKQCAKAKPMVGTKAQHGGFALCPQSISSNKHQKAQLEATPQALQVRAVLIIPGSVLGSPAQLTAG